LHKKLKTGYAAKSILLKAYWFDENYDKSIICPWLLFYSTTVSDDISM
jgi:hypothetical protein